jgi:hypothetical protein
MVVWNWKIILRSHFVTWPLSANSDALWVDGANLKKYKMADVESSKKPIQSSLVTDVLQKTGHLDQEDFHSCVKKMLQKAEEVKVKANLTQAFRLLLSDKLSRFHRFLARKSYFYVYSLFVFFFFLFITLY